MTKLLAELGVSSGDCSLCGYLFESVTAASLRHVTQLARLSAAVTEDPADEAKIAAVRRIAEILNVCRTEAEERYDRHLLTHHEIRSETHQIQSEVQSLVWPVTR